MCAGARSVSFGPTLVETVEDRRSRYTVPVVDEALCRRYSLEATWRRRRNPATHRERPGAPVIVLDAQDRESPRASWVARTRYGRSLPAHESSHAIAAASRDGVAHVLRLPRSAPGGGARRSTVAGRGDERSLARDRDAQPVGRRR